MRPDLVPAAEAVWNLTLGCAFNADPPQVFEVLSAADLERLLAAAKTALVAPALDLHRPCCQPDGPEKCAHGYLRGHDGDPPLCLSCRDQYGEFLPYPCPTARALGVGDDTTTAPGGQPS